MKVDTETEAAVMNVVKQAFEAFTRRDLDGFLNFFAPDPDVVVIGTGGDEKCIGPAGIRAIIGRAFAQFEDAYFEFGWHSVSAAGSVAWVAADLVLHVKIGGRDIIEPLRLTVVLEQRGDRWLIVQAHDSVPDVRQKEGEAFPT